MEVSPLLPASVSAASVLLKAVATDVTALVLPSPAAATATADPEAAVRSQLTNLVTSEKPPPLADSLQTLKAELADRPEERQAIDQVLPDDREPPTPDRLRTAVRDGGNHLESKLARGERVPPGSDLKADLLNLARTLPAAALALSAVERQQAANALAPPGLAVYAIPFPDGPNRRTLGLGVEVDQPDADGTPSSRFRVTLHVPLSGLGETWIDAAGDGSRLRTVLFVSDAAGRERVRAEADGLAAELRKEGFASVSVEVRDATEMNDSQRRRANAVREGLPAGGVLDVVA